MIINNIEEINSRIDYLTVNPFLPALETALNDLAYYRDEIDSYNNSIKEAQERILDRKAKIIARKALIESHSYKIRLLKEQSDNVKPPENLKGLLDLNALKASFRGLGLEFVSLEFNRTTMYLRYTRPNSMIESLPVPPLLITLSYHIQNNCNTIKNVLVSKPFHSTAYIHPHISSDARSATVCLGNFLDVLSNNECGKDVLSYLDHVILVERLLVTYNSDSPYLSTSSIIGNYLSRRQIEPWDISNGDRQIKIVGDIGVISDYSGFTRFTQLLKREHYSAFVDSIGKLSSHNVLESYLSEAMSASHEDSREDAEYLDLFINRIRNQVPSTTEGTALLNTLPKLYQYTETEYSDDNENEDTVIYEDNFNEVMGLLIDFINEALKLPETTIAEATQYLPSVENVYREEIRLEVNNVLN
jgi:hypothetical protein